jgi:hypothetical protein
MKRDIRWLPLALLALAVCLYPAQSQASAPPKIDGIWDGTLEVGQDKTPFTLHVSSGASGKISVLIDSPNSNQWEVPAVSAQFQR